jgi:hypothetical protein
VRSEGFSRASNRWYVVFSVYGAFLPPMVTCRASEGSWGVLRTVLTGGPGVVCCAEIGLFQYSARERKADGLDRVRCKNRCVWRGREGGQSAWGGPTDR